MSEPVPRVLLVDNRDSFTWNIFHLAKQCGAAVDVMYRHNLSDGSPQSAGYSHVIIGPGPCRPEDSRGSLDIVRRSAGIVPVLGICLGMQIMAYLWGGTVCESAPLHGSTDTVVHRGDPLFSGMPRQFSVARYNSLSVTDAGKNLAVTAENEQGVIMALRHGEFPMITGVQFHPESFMTLHGVAIMKNFLADYGARA